MIHGSHEEWTRKTTAVREAIDKFKTSSQSSEDVKEFASDLEKIELQHESVQLKFATDDRKTSSDDLHARLEIGMRLTKLSEELGVPYDPWIAAPRPSLNELMDSMTGQHKETQAGFRRGEVVMLSAGQSQRMRVINEVNMSLYQARERGHQAVIDEFTPRPPVIPLGGHTDRHIGIDKHLFDILDQGNGVKKNNVRPNIVGDTIYGINMISDDPYELESAVPDDVGIDQDPNYQSRNGPGKPKSHVTKRGRPSSAVMNLMARFYKK